LRNNLSGSLLLSREICTGTAKNCANRLPPTPRLLVKPVVLFTTTVKRSEFLQANAALITVAIEVRRP
jgi:hypothetical protein